MGESWQLALQRIRESCRPFERFMPFVASGLTLVAGFCPSRSLRYLCLSLAVALFLLIAADLARSLLDEDLNRPHQYASSQGPPEKIPVSPFQILLAAMLALLYASMIFAGLHIFFVSSIFLSVVMAAGVLVLSGLAAWRNVRLWYREGTDYEQALKEEAATPHTLHIRSRY